MSDGIVAWPRPVKFTASIVRHLRPLWEAPYAVCSGV
jgi:hypothetical protein